MLVACVPISAEGHLNTSLGLALALKNNGHDVVYVIEKTYAGRFLKHGFKEEVYFEFGLDEDGSKTVNWEEYIKNLFPLIRLPPTEQSQFYQGIFKRQLKNLEKSDDQILAIINTVKPDIILLDSCLLSASVLFCGIPFVAHCPLNPLAVIHNENLPPPWSAFSLLDKDESKWTEQRERWLKEFVSNTEYSNWLVSKGAPPLTGCCHNSPYLNLITYPKALLAHYLKYYEMGPNWFSVDHCIRPNSDSFEVPEKLRTLPGKLIMLSMGSLGSADVELMKKLVDILSKTNHRYIVNGGRYHGQYQLANNMWGASFLPQLAVLQVVDLFITHGGNNSFIESLYYGVPMVVIPLFVDQFDNAAMAEDGKVGLKFMPFLEPKENLVDKLETVLNSDEIRQNVKAISESLQESKSLDEAVKRMEAIVDKRRNISTNTSISS